MNPIPRLVQLRAQTENYVLVLNLSVDIVEDLAHGNLRIMGGSDP